jgi:hypothetical protein
MTALQAAVVLRSERCCAWRATSVQAKASSLSWLFCGFACVACNQPKDSTTVKLELRLFGTVCAGLSAEL